MATHTRLPSDTQGRLHVFTRDQAGDMRFSVLLARPPLMPTADTFAEQLDNPAVLLPLLTHDKGTSWADEAGVVLARAALESGGMACMLFQSMDDALGALSRVQRGRA